MAPFSSFFRYAGGTVLWMAVCGLAILAGETPSKPTAEAVPKTPTCALIDVAKSPLAALVEAKLLENPERRWLERGELEKVLKEQELQSLLGAQAALGRIKLGQLLKAKILVFLRTGEKPLPDQKQKVKYAELVVSETDRGVRLLARTVPLSEDGEADAASLVRLAEHAIGRHGQETREICAVPSFVSQDLTYECDYLKAAYAKLVEEVLLERPGIVVVELAEAEAIIRETRLGGDGSAPSRQLPLYVLGEYHTQRKGDARQVTLNLTLKRGEQQVDVTSATLPEAKVPDFLRQFAGKVASGNKIPAPAVDPAAEAKQLADRAMEFMRLGNAAEALPLIETSLMLKPEQVDMHRAALGALTKRFGLSPEDDLKRYRRGLEHLEMLITTGGDPAQY